MLLVTGGSRGIGAAIVRLAAARGWKVCFSFLSDHQAAESLLRELEAAGHEARMLRGDVADEAFPRQLFDYAEATLGPVQGVVNNAGITGPIGVFKDTSIGTLRRTLDVNLMGTMLLSREAIRRWENTRTQGRIVNLSSIAATLGAPGEYVHYAASKAAIDAFTTGLGKEVAAKGIRVNAVAPGTAYTDIHAAAGEPDRPSRVVARVPAARIAEPEEIAEGVVWLLSDEASYVNATVLRIAGGL
ncbi:SDR family oxidoreductase [Mesorhizobium sp. 1B3]|uniref:SDR family oxidoreductase n=1 Tax=Mesorhizobium sp. 1B3 TaxID=3243599 RepID=UPI003D9545F4